MISNGHQINDINKMTVGQIKGFLGAIAKRTAGLRALFVTDVALGAQCDGKAIKKAVENYNKVRYTSLNKKIESNYQLTEADIEIDDTEILIEP